VDGCEVSAEAVDHIQQTSLEMPDALWFDMDNLRASCWRHNEWKARRKVEMEGGNQRRSFRAPMQQQTPLFSRPLPPPIRGSLSLTRTAYGRPATRTA
jgi:hypothetical protein